MATSLSPISTPSFSSQTHLPHSRNFHLPISLPSSSQAQKPKKGLVSMARQDSSSPSSLSANCHLYMPISHIHKHPFFRLMYNVQVIMGPQIGVETVGQVQERGRESLGYSRPWEEEFFENKQDENKRNSPKAAKHINQNTPSLNILQKNCKRNSHKAAKHNQPKHPQFRYLQKNCKIVFLSLSHCHSPLGHGPKSFPLILCSQTRIKCLCFFYLKFNKVSAYETNLKIRGL